jgi:hypothetical protein
MSLGEWSLGEWSLGERSLGEMSLGETSLGERTLIHYSLNLGYFCNYQKTTQSKQSRNGRKFAQCGHPLNYALTLRLSSKICP